jgi:hypothetical protein
MDIQVRVWRPAGRDGENGRRVARVALMIPDRLIHADQPMGG